MSLEVVRIVAITSCLLPADMPCANCLPGSSNHQVGCIDVKESKRLERRARIFPGSVWNSGRATTVREENKRAKSHMSYGAQYRNDDRDRMIFLFDRTPCGSPLCRHQLPAASVVPYSNLLWLRIPRTILALGSPDSSICHRIEHRVWCWYCW